MIKHANMTKHLWNMQGTSLLKINKMIMTGYKAELIEIYQL